MRSGMERGCLRCTREPSLFEVTHRRAGKVDADVLDLRVRLEPLAAKFAADSAVLEAGVGQVYGGDVVAVDPDGPGSKRPRRAMRPRDVSCPYARRKSVRRRVRKSYCRVFVIEPMN